MLLRLREALARPVAWGAVLLSYVGIFVGFGFAVYTLHDANDAERRAATALVAEQKRADAEIVRTGQAAIRSGCVFDNQRARELRGILQRSLDNQKSLLARGAIQPELARENIRITRESLRQISVRDCDKAAAVLTDNPKEK